MKHKRTILFALLIYPIIGFSGGGIVTAPTQDGKSSENAAIQKLKDNAIEIRKLFSDIDSQFSKIYKKSNNIKVLIKNGNGLLACETLSSIARNIKKIENKALNKDDDKKLLEYKKNYEKSKNIIKNNKIKCY